MQGPRSHLAIPRGRGRPSQRHCGPNLAYRAFPGCPQYAIPGAPATTGLHSGPQGEICTQLALHACMCACWMRFGHTLTRTERERESVCIAAAPHAHEAEIGRYACEHHANVLSLGGLGLSANAGTAQV